MCDSDPLCQRLRNQATVVRNAVGVRIWVDILFFSRSFCEMLSRSLSSVMRKSAFDSLQSER